MSLATWGAEQKGSVAGWHDPYPVAWPLVAPSAHLEEVAGDERSLDVEHVGVGAEGGG